MKKIICFFILGIMLLILLFGALLGDDASIAALFTMIVLIGLGLAFGAFQAFRSSSSAAAKSTARTTSNPMNTGTGPERTPAPPPQPQMVCPECGKKYPPGQVYCDECGALLKETS